MFLVHLMYKSVAFYCDINLGYIFLYHLYIIKHMLWIFTSRGHFECYLFWKTNCFQYSFIKDYSSCFIIINATVVQIVFCERNHKRKITVKTPLTNNCNAMVDPVKIVFRLDQFWVWIYVKEVIIFIFFVQYFIQRFALWFFLLPWMIQCHILSKFKPIIWL